MQESPYCFVDVETEHRLLEAISTRCAADWLTDVHQFAPLLVHLMRECRRASVDHLEPVVREIVREHTRVPAFSGDEEEIDQHVAILIEAMDEVRDDQIRAGRWSDCPVPPMMFG